MVQNLLDDIPPIDYPTLKADEVGLPEPTSSAQQFPPAAAPASLSPSPQPPPPPAPVLKTELPTPPAVDTSISGTSIVRQGQESKEHPIKNSIGDQFRG